MSARTLRGYYAILDVKGAGDAAADALSWRADALLAAGPCCLQLRAKALDAAALRDAATVVRDRCRAVAVPFCLNDRVDVALAVGADVVHVGQDDLPLDEVRRLVERREGRRPLVGVSTHSLAQALAAERGGADYVGFGPVFGTRTKANPDPVVGLDGLRAVVGALRIPVVAIGGITVESVPAVVDAGAAAAAVISAVDDAPDRTAAGLRVKQAFAGAASPG